MTSRHVETERVIQIAKRNLHLQGVPATLAMLEAFNTEQEEPIDMAVFLILTSKLPEGDCKTLCDWLARCDTYRGWSEAKLKAYEAEHAQPEPTDEELDDFEEFYGD